MKTDLRVRYTQQVIQQAFLELLKEKPVNRITVKEVCEKAEINRGTFYKHYLDCYDLMEKLEDQTLKEFDALLAMSSANDGGITTLSVILQMLKNNQVMLKGITQRNENPRFVRKLTQRYLQFMEQAHREENSAQQDEAQEKMYCIFLAGGCGAITEYWIQTGMKEPPEQIANDILTFIKQMKPGQENATS